MQNIIENNFNNHIDTTKKSLDILKNDIETLSKLAIQTIKSGNKIVLCGNGGSASDAQHIAAELSGRFQKERKGLAAISINTDTSAITAIANDYGFENIFSRQIEAIGNSDDLLIVISTSGNSKNIINAIKKAKKLNIKTASFGGNSGGEVAKLCDINLIVPSNITARVQEIHILIGHTICNIIDEEFYSIKDL